MQEYRKLRSFLPGGGIFFLAEINSPGGKLACQGGLVVFLSDAIPRGVSTPGGCEIMVVHTHTEATAMDKVYKQAFKRQRVEEQNKSTQCEEKEESKKDSSEVSRHFVVMRVTVTSHDKFKNTTKTTD